MSIDRCARCNDPVDTDFDCDFYVLDRDGCLIEGLCERCREDAEEQELQNEFAAFLQDYKAETLEQKT